MTEPINHLESLCARLIDSGHLIAEYVNERNQYVLDIAHPMPAGYIAPKRFNRRVWEVRGILIQQLQFRNGTRVRTWAEGAPAIVHSALIEAARLGYI